MRRPTLRFRQVTRSCRKSCGGNWRPWASSSAATDSRVMVLPITKSRPGGIMRKLLFAALALAPVLGFAGYALAQRGGPPPHPGVPLARDLQAKMPLPEKVFDWAYPMAPPNTGPRPDPNETFTAAGADPSLKLTRRQIADAFNPPDWFPKDHAPMPPVVAHGREPHVRAC